jgi:chromosome segregation ATPase
VSKLRTAAASASSGDSAALKQVELCEEKIVALEAEISRLKLMLHARDSELCAAKDEVLASRESAAIAKGKEGDIVHAKDLQSLRDELSAARAQASAASAHYDAVVKRESDLLVQFEELKRAFHAATESASAADTVAPEVVEKLKKDAEALRVSEMSTRGELCLMKEQLQTYDQKLQTLQTQLQAEKQRSERLRREKEDLELANSCMKGEMSTMKRVTVNQDRCVGRCHARCSARWSQLCLQLRGRSCG